MSRNNNNNNNSNRASGRRHDRDDRYRGASDNNRRHDDYRRHDRRDDRELDRHHSSSGNRRDEYRRDDRRRDDYPRRDNTGSSHRRDDYVSSSNRRRDDHDDWCRDDHHHPNSATSGGGSSSGAAASVPPRYKCPLCQKLGAHFIVHCPILSTSVGRRCFDHVHRTEGCVECGSKGHITGNGKRCLNNAPLACTSCGSYHTPVCSDPRSVPEISGNTASATPSSSSRTLSESAAAAAAAAASSATTTSGSVALAVPLNNFAHPKWVPCPYQRQPATWHEFYDSQKRLVYYVDAAAQSELRTRKATLGATVKELEDELAESLAERKNRAAAATATSAKSDTGMDAAAAVQEHKNEGGEEDFEAHQRQQQQQQQSNEKKDKKKGSDDDDDDASHFFSSGDAKKNKALGEKKTSRSADAEAVEAKHNNGTKTTAANINGNINLDLPPVTRAPEDIREDLKRIANQIADLHSTATWVPPAHPQDVVMWFCYKCEHMIPSKFHKCPGCSRFRWPFLNRDEAESQQLQGSRTGGASGRNRRRGGNNNNNSNNSRRRNGGGAGGGRRGGGGSRN